MRGHIKLFTLRMDLDDRTKQLKSAKVEANASFGQRRDMSVSADSPYRHIPGELIPGRL